MSSLEGKLSQAGSVVIYAQASTYFSVMNSKMQQSIGSSLVIEKSYLSKYEVVDELRLALDDQYRTTKPPGVSDQEFDTIKPLLDTTKPMTEIGTVKSDFEALETYINKLAADNRGLFNPPLGRPFTVQNTQVYPIPQSSIVDPRRFGRLIQCNNRFDPAIKRWLINNALLFGFTLYEDYGLYYIGFREVQSQATSNTAVQNLINKFQRTPIPAGDVSLTATQIQAAKDPVSGDLEVAVLSQPVPDNDGNTFTELYLVPGDSQTAKKEVAQAAKMMATAAKADGITLVVNSGFRPATQTGVTWTTASGKRGSLTTQETLRRQKDRWIRGSSAYINFVTNGGSNGGRYGNKSGEEAFVFYAPSNAFNAATAPPGHSDHGSGVALDFNTGGQPFGPVRMNIYTWMVNNAHKFGFIRTVSSEEWHFEYRPNDAVRGPYAKVPKTNPRWHGLTNVTV